LTTPNTFERFAYLLATLPAILNIFCIWSCSHRPEFSYFGDSFLPQLDGRDAGTCIRKL